MTDILRKLPCDDLGSALPTDAVNWANQANKEVSEAWNRIPIMLTNIAGTNDVTAILHSDIPLEAYQEGQAYWFIPANDNSGPMTININEVGETGLVDRDGAALASGAILAGRSYQIVRIGSSFRIIDSIVSEATVPLPRGYINGLITTTNTLDTNHDIDIAAGVCRNAQNTGNMVLLTGLTKRSDAVWVQGTNQGGMLQSDNLTGTITVTTNTSVTGSGTSFLADFEVGQVITTAGGQARRITVISSDTAMTVASAWSAGEVGVTFKRGGKAPSTLYRILGIRKDSDGTVDVAFCPEGVPTDLPAGWSTYRTLWHFITDTSSNNRAYTQIGNNGLFTTAFTDATRSHSNASSGTTTTNHVLSAPPNSSTQLLAVSSIGFVGSGVTGDLAASIRATASSFPFYLNSISTPDGTAVTGEYKYTQAQVDSNREVTIVHQWGVNHPSIARTFTTQITIGGWIWDRSVIID